MAQLKARKASERPSWEPRGSPAPTLHLRCFLISTGKIGTLVPPLPVSLGCLGTQENPAGGCGETGWRGAISEERQAVSRRDDYFTCGRHVWATAAGFFGFIRKS